MIQDQRHLNIPLKFWGKMVNNDSKIKHRNKPLINNGNH